MWACLWGICKTTSLKFSSKIQSDFALGLFTDIFYDIFYDILGRWRPHHWPDSDIDIACYCFAISEKCCIFAKIIGHDYDEVCP